MKHALTFAGIVVAAASVLAVLSAPVEADNFSIGINVGTPPPPPPPTIAWAAPPPLVLVPGLPVSYAPSVDINFFAYGGRYYTYHSGAWFVSPTYSGPWHFTAVERIPKPVLAVPVAYYRVPPGHLKKAGGRPPWASHGKGHRHKWIGD